MTLASVTLRARVLIAVAGTSFAMLAAPAAGQMSVAVKVFEDFATDGLIDPCKHTSEELREVLKHIPPDVEQYAPDYPAGVEGALEARARGECEGVKPLPPAAIATPTPTATPTPAPTAVPMKTVVDDPPAPEVAAVLTTTAAAKSAARPDVALRRAATARPANGAPAPVLLLALLAALLGLATAVLATARRFGFADGVWHAWSEAAYRAGGVWQDFRDWLRIGR